MTADEFGIYVAIAVGLLAAATVIPHMLRTWPQSKRLEVVGALLGLGILGVFLRLWLNDVKDLDGVIRELTKVGMGSTARGAIGLYSFLIFASFLLVVEIIVAFTQRIKGRSKNDQSGSE